MPSSAVVHKMKEYIKISHTSQSNLIRRRLQYWLVLVLLERWDFVFNNGEFSLIIIYVFVFVALFHLFLLMMTVIMFHIILDKHRMGFIISDVKVPLENWHILLRWFFMLWMLIITHGIIWKFSFLWNFGGDGGWHRLMLQQAYDSFIISQEI